MAKKEQTEREKYIQQLKAKIITGCKAAKLEADSYPQTWRDKVLEDVPVIPTPSPSLNEALGVGGFPYGRLVEIYGTASSGKTTLALQMAAAAQKAGRDVAFIDMAQSLDAKYAEALGVNMDDLFISQPMTGDDALALTKVMIQAGLGLVVIDDVPSMAAKAELEKEITDSNVGLQARMMSQGLRQLMPIMRIGNTCVIFINQIRMKIGVMYGNPETTPGGESLKFFSSMRLEMRATSKRDDDSTHSRVKVVKNKLAPPHRQCEIKIVYGQGIDGSDETFGIAVQKGIVKKSGAWYTLPRLDCPGMVLAPEDEELRFHGEENARVFMDQTEGYMEALTECVQAQKPAEVAAEPEREQETANVG